MSRSPPVNAPDDGLVAAQLSAKHLPAYLDEMAFRYNNRENPYLFRDTPLVLIGAEAMPYKSLIR